MLVVKNTFDVQQKYLQASHLETGVDVHQPVADVGDLGAEEDGHLVEVMKRSEVSVGREDFELRHVHRIDHRHEEEARVLFMFYNKFELGVLSRVLSSSCCYMLSMYLRSIDGQLRPRSLSRHK